MVLLTFKKRIKWLSKVDFFFLAVKHCQEAAVPAHSANESEKR